MTVWSQEYRSPSAYWSALTARAKAQARASGDRPDQLTGEFVRQMLLARIFSQQQSPWVVAGGTGMLIRIPGARHTDDLDLVSRSRLTHDQLVEELTAFTGESPRDPFSFRIASVENFAGEITGTKVRVHALIAGKRAHEFDVDITAKSMIGRVDRATPTPAVSGMRGLTLPPVVVYPVAAQTADKLAAMYRHRRDEATEVSTRYRDLVDLVLLSLHTRAPAADLAAAIAQTRTAVPLPDHMQSPGPQWPTRYAKSAADTAVPVELRELPAALAQVGRWLDPILAGGITTGHEWDPHTARWIPSSELVDPPQAEQPPRVEQAVDSYRKPGRSTIGDLLAMTGPREPFDAPAPDTSVDMPAPEPPSPAMGYDVDL